jgi:septal ring factor EnvC (AmiA/AmiB activator)
MARKFVYGLAILIFMASGYITFLAVRGPVPKRILNEYVPHQNNGKGLPDKRVAERVVNRKEQSIGSVNGLEKETSSLQKKVGDSGNILKVQQHPQSVVDEKLARLKREKEAEQAQVPPQVVEELARVEQEEEALRTKAANLDEHIKTLQREPAQVRQDETAARTVASTPSAEGPL